MPANDVIQAFLKEAASNPSLAECLNKAASMEEVLEIAASHGFQISLEEAQQGKSSGISELDDAELEVIAGGGTLDWNTWGPTCWA